MQARAEIDICLVAGRRPELLAPTLESFQRDLFAHFRVRHVFANIDPFAGTADDGEACRAMILARFPDATIRMPETASFGGAVKWLWSQAADAPVLHMEDDWVLLRPFTPDDVLPHFSETVTAVVPYSANHGTVEGHVGVRVEKDKVLGLTWRRRTVGLFGTSPRFISGGFARRCAELMDPDLDPEKQMRPPHNPSLRSFTAPFRSWFVYGPGGGPAIEDIGREWRERSGLDKVVVDGRSEWRPRG